MIGDLLEPNLGVDRRARRRSTTSSTSPRSTTWAPTRSATRCSTSAARRTRSTSPTRSRSGRFHHMSSIAVAGHYDEGTFNEDMFDEGQPLTHPYHRTKFESEKLVRERVKQPVARLPPIARRRRQPHRRDGQDRRAVLLLQADPEGPQDAAAVVPADLARVGLDQHRPGRLRRRGRRPHRPPGRPRRPGLPRRRPEGPARRRGPEHVRRRRPRAQGRDADRPARDRQPAQGRRLVRDEAARRSSRSAPTCSPTSASRTRSSTTSRSAAASTRATPSARCADSGIELPPLVSYADKLWDYWERQLDPDLYKDHCFEGAVNGKTVVITGASAGIGREAALKIAAAGGIPILVARTKEKLDEVKDEIERAGGTAYVAPCDLSDYDAIEKLVETLLADHAADRHAGQQRGPQHPPQRRALLRPLPRLRADGPAQLPVAGQADARPAAAHARPGRRPHRQRVLDRRPDQPAAVQRLRRLQGGAGRVHARGAPRRRSATT